MRARCAFCGSEIEVEGRPGRGDECPSCRRDLHACVQCRFHDRSFHNQCRESQAAQVSDKERANFCEFFELGRDAAAERASADRSKENLEGLFKR